MGVKHDFYKFREKLKIKFNQFWFIVIFVFLPPKFKIVI